MQDRRIAVRGTRRGCGDCEQGRAVERALGIFVDERQLVARPVAQAVQHGGHGRAGSVRGLAAGGVIAEDDGGTVGPGSARPGHRGPVPAEVGDGAARPVRR